MVHASLRSSFACLRLVLGAMALCFACLLVGPLTGCESSGSFRGSTQARQGEVVRGIWVTRWDYRSPVHVERAIDDIAAAGFTDVYWQVRGQADAYYRSTLEPWGEDLFRDRPGVTDPGFDPLAVAVARATQRGVRLHAWVNVYPLWKGTEAPRDPRHPLTRRPDWRLVDQTGEVQPLNDHYVVFNPTDPGAQAHIAAVCRDIVSRYALDGLHLDYVRFVNDTMETGKLYPADGASIQRFYNATGRRSLTTVEDKAAHAGWVRDEITGLVRRLSREAKRVRPGIEVSAAVWRTPQSARETVLQDATAWVDEGIVDRILPMLYTESNADYVRDLNLWLDAAGDAVTPGIGSYMHSPTQTLEQIRLSDRAGGYALFAFATVFESANPFESNDQTSQALRTSRRRALEAVQGAWRDGTSR